MERDRFVVPAGREFLCRREVLGVPGTLDGLSHVVSECSAEGKKDSDIRRAVSAIIFFCHFVNSVGIICG